MTDDLVKSFPCGKGWLPIAKRLDAAVMAIDPQATLEGIKEKYGVMRVEYRCSANLPADKANEVESLIEAAEQESERTCDICGKPGHLVMKNGWANTRCIEHA